jgi:hypothetical protein
MNEPQTTTALLSPVSDVSFGGPGAPLSLLFGRNGGDIFQGFDPATANDDRIKPDTDLLLGDFFDNTSEEFLTVLAIQGNLGLVLPPGSPVPPPDTFAILNPNTLAPFGLKTPTPSSAGSVAADRFVLGDVFQPYYTSFDPASSINTDPFGLNQFALIYDFAPTVDTIQLNGKKGDYLLLEIDSLADPSFGPTPFSGQAIFSLQQGIPDLVGLVVSPPEVNLDLNADYFRFVGNKPPKKPANKKIGQLSTNGIDLGFDIAADASGNIYVTGSTSGDLFGSKGLNDGFVAKYDTNANQVSGTQIGTAAADNAFRVVTDAAGNYYLAGTTSGDLFGKVDPNADQEEAWVAKYNKDGVLQWGKQFAVSGAFTTGTTGLQVDNDGNVLLSGLAIKDNTTPGVLFPVEDDAWVAKFNGSNGNEIWRTTDPEINPVDFLDTPAFHETYNLAVDNAGNSYLVGWTQGLVEESDPGRDVQKYDAWFARVDSNGKINLLQQFGSSDQGLDFAQGIDIDSKGNIYVLGWTTGIIGTQVGERDLFLAKFDPVAGDLVKAIQIGSAKDDGVLVGDLVIDDQDQIYVTGHTNGKAGKGKGGGKDASGFDALVGKFDTELNNSWLRRFGDKDQYDNPTGIDVRGDRVYVTGFSEGFLGQNAAKKPGGAFDAWVAELNAKNGKVEKFSGNAAASVDFEAAESDPVTNITSSLETKEELPQGDFKIDPTGGRATGSFNYGDFLQSFGKSIDPTAKNSVQSALMDAIMNDDPSVFGDNVQGLKLEGTDGNDPLMGLVGDDKIKGKKGDDTLSGLAGNDELEGDQGNDTLIGGAGNDKIKGNAGNDTLTGVDPAAALPGSGEKDTLTAGGGKDLFVLGDKTNPYYKDKGNLDYALISDFKKGENTIQLYGNGGLNAASYRLEENLAGLEKGTAIFYTGDSVDDLVGIVEGVKLQELSLTDPTVFEFA